MLCFLDFDYQSSHKKWNTNSELEFFQNNFIYFSFSKAT
jgi:hypothetical protein